MTLKRLKHILTLLAVIFLFSAPALVPCHEFQIFSRYIILNLCPFGNIPTDGDGCKSGQIFAGTLADKTSIVVCGLFINWKSACQKKITSATRKYSKLVRKHGIVHRPCAIPCFLTITDKFRENSNLITCQLRAYKLLCCVYKSTIKSPSMCMQATYTCNQFISVCL